MPNHLHAIVCVKGDNVRPAGIFEQRSPTPSLRANSDESRVVPKLSGYIGSFKGMVTKYAKKLGMDFAWHSRYHDRAIRNTEEANKIAKYIENNIIKWLLDRFYR